MWLLGINFDANLIMFIVALYVTCVCVVFSLAAGLYQLAVLAEDYNAIARRVVKYLIYGTTGAIVYAWIFQRISITYIVLPLVSRFLYMSIMKGSPILNYQSAEPIAALVLLIINSIRWYSYHRNVLYSQILEAVVFLFAVELLPAFALLTTLSVNEPLLPGAEGEEEEAPRLHRIPLVVDFLRKASDAILTKLHPLLSKMHLTQGTRRPRVDLLL
ncbi:hypothetical protein P9112_012486 [Eukaryota sp. TZLM1-RC]